MSELITTEEALYFYPLVILIVLVLARNFLSAKYYDVWSPMTFVSITFFYYAIAGPLTSIYYEDTYYRLVDHRPFFRLAWLAALISFVFILLGFNLNLFSKGVQRLRPVADTNFVKSANKLFVVGVIGVFVSFGLSSITNVNFLSGEALEMTAIAGGFGNYFLFMMNFFISACCFLFVARLDGKYSGVILVIAIVYATSLYITLGFRYRVILLVLSLFSTYYLYKQTKPSFPFIAVISILLITAMGLIGDTRSYFGGLNVSRIGDRGFFDFFLSGFTETQTFETTGLLLERIPESYPHIGLQPLWETVAMPIPRQLWPNKPTGESLESIMSIYYTETGFDDAGTGAAILNFGEYYLAYGWVGIIVASLLLGMFLRSIWNWYLINRDSRTAIIFIAVFNSFIYVIISRGYLPQVVMNFAFTLGPVLWVRWRAKRRNLRQ